MKMNPWQMANSEWRAPTAKSAQRLVVSKNGALSSMIFALSFLTALIFALCYTAQEQQPP
jgi:hypothetical protein